MDVDMEEGCCSRNNERVFDEDGFEVVQSRKKKGHKWIENNKNWSQNVTKICYFIYIRIKYFLYAKVKSFFEKIKISPSDIIARKWRPKT